MEKLRHDANQIIEQSIKAVLPDTAVIKALENRSFVGQVIVVAIGKASWQMAHTARQVLGNRINRGIVITKYGHSNGDIEGIEIIEAGHPIADENSTFGTGKVLEMVSSLSSEDHVIFLVSGGGSALFEKPMPGVELEDIMDVTDQLLKSGADIVEINTIRKHLSAVKGGRFAQYCEPAQVLTIVLSDVLGDRLDSIASGPAHPDSSTSEEAFKIIDKYGFQVTDHLREVIGIETPKVVSNCETIITGSVTELCNAAANVSRVLGYTPYILSTLVDGEAREVGAFMSSIAKSIYKGDAIFKRPCAVIMGGETIVKVKGTGLGGRNQELVLSAAISLNGIPQTVIFSIGSDGTDGPTDAAGGMIDGETLNRILKNDIPAEVYLDDNDSYHALQVSGDLVVTGSTGTNVNDLMVILCE